MKRSSSAELGVTAAVAAAGSATAEQARAAITKRRLGLVQPQRHELLMFDLSAEGERNRRLRR
jgi:hypothetical protein